VPQGDHGTVDLTFRRKNALPGRVRGASTCSHPERLRHAALQTDDQWDGMLKTPCTRSLSQQPLASPGRVLTRLPRGTHCQFITWPQPVNPHRGSLSLPRVAQGIVAKSGLSTDSLRPSSIAHGFGSACRTCSLGPGMRVAPLGFREEQP